MSQIPGVPDHAAPAPPWVARARKFLVSVVGLAAEVVAAGVVHGTAQIWLQTAIGIATAAGIYTVPNAPTTPARAA